MYAFFIFACLLLNIVSDKIVYIILCNYFLWNKSVVHMQAVVPGKTCFLQNALIHNTNFYIKCRLYVHAIHWIQKHIVFNNVLNCMNKVFGYFMFMHMSSLWHT